MTPERIALIGYGEVGRTIATDLRASAVEPPTAWDRLFSDASSAPSLALAIDGSARGAASMEGAVANADLVISAVTAADCVAAAREAAPHLARGTLWLDLNSVAPTTKIAAAQLITDVGGAYVEAAVMSPIGLKRIASPVLLGGPHAAGFAPTAHRLGFTGAKVFSAELGRASAAKMCRSVVVKGMEALLMESLLAARYYGVEDAVLASLNDLLPGHNWRELSRYMVSRSLQHGQRRAEEMREVARTVADARLTPWMSSASAERQAWAATHGDFHGIPDLTQLLVALFERIRRPR
jgi:3-hydroxyisobutyrate dehydrogenase-like beta-hydroxyacid dehydrogenase